MRCLQVPGWRAQNCWLDFSFYCCCCCCCCSLRNSLCCRQTFFVSFSCWGLVLLARLDKEQRDICETCVGPCWTFDFEMKVALFSPGGATIRCHFWNRQVLRQSRGLRLYVLCLDISSCMGSRITQSCGREKNLLVHFFNSHQPFCRLMEMNLLGGSSA